MTKTISVKELRQHFPDVRKQLEKGVGFIIIHRSKPIGELTPLRDAGKKIKSKALDVFVHPPKGLEIKSRKSAVDLARNERF